eukprot:GFUD01030081.1.p1 GENE.GFUD01030081.1~~GFUD01030081.1.p1  ORF type:complete len:384 (+),score=64.80 GFUD01030081.1:172-1323(+)
MIHPEGFHQPDVNPPDGGYELTEDLAFIKRKVLPALFSHPYIAPFRSPVNAKAEGIYPDYFKVVTKPMDLRTVKARLENGWYWDIAQCTADINQVWYNAKAYNPPEHTIYKWAVTMSSVTNAWLQKVPQVAKLSDANKSNVFNLKVCENILETIMNDKSLRHCSEPFLIITSRYANDTYTPMDLDHIKKKLLAGFYKNAQDFATDFRQMISETYRFCIDKDPIIEQAQELHHQFEMAFAKRIQTTTEEEVVVEVPEPIVEDVEMDETEILQNILSVGRAMEVELDNMVKKELEALEGKRFEDARLLVKEIEDIAPEIMEEVIGIMQKNKESLDVESDGTVAVSYDDLSAKTIYEIRKLIRAKNTLKQTSLKLEDESMNIDVLS